MMPFGPIDSPSLGLSSLSQCLWDEGFSCKVFYPNLDFAGRIGDAAYDALALGYSKLLLGDWLFSQALSEAGNFSEFIQSLTHTELSEAQIEEVSRLLTDCLPIMQDFIQDWVELILKIKPRVVGLSSSYQQHLACLALAKRLKKACPEILVVLGGFNCNDVMGSETFKRFDFLDAVVSGRGELVFPELVKLYLAGEKNIKLPGLYWRHALEEDNLAVRIAPEPDLNALPVPDFKDFFEVCPYEMNQVYLPVETSRGCWWGQKQHCVFCSENAEAMNFRGKKPDKILDEWQVLYSRYPDAQIAATDEILDLRLIDSVLNQVAEWPERKKIFFSIKANIRKDQLIKLVKAGVDRIQPGIESLSDDLLRDMRKGVTGLQNIQLLKWCRELGIGVSWAILYGFPFEKGKDYREMADIAPWLTHLPPPLNAVMIILHRFSPLYQAADSFGVQNIKPHASYHFIYGLDEAVLQRLAYRFSWDCEREEPVADYIAPLKKEVKTWKRNFQDSMLFYYDRDAVMLIADTRAIARKKFYCLTGLERLVYLTCDQVRTLSATLKLVNQMGYTIDSQELEDILNQLIENRLMINKNNQYLSLAYRLNQRCMPPVDLMIEVLNKHKLHPELKPDV